MKKWIGLEKGFPLRLCISATKSRNCSTLNNASLLSDIDDCCSVDCSIVEVELVVADENEVDNPLTIIISFLHFPPIWFRSACQVSRLLLLLDVPTTWFRRRHFLFVSALASQNKDTLQYTTSSEQLNFSSDIDVH